MSLKEEDRNALILIRLKRAKETMSEVYGNVQLGYWRIVANRLYYACYYAVSALLIKNGLTTHEIDKQDIVPLIEPAEKFITEIEILILNS